MNRLIALTVFGSLLCLAGAASANGRGWTRSARTAQIKAGIVRDLVREGEVSPSYAPQAERLIRIRSRATDFTTGRGGARQHRAVGFRIDTVNGRIRGTARAETPHNMLGGSRGWRETEVTGLTVTESPYPPLR